MGFKAKTTSNKSNAPRVEQAPLPIGSHEARVVQVLTLGLQAQRPYRGEEKKPCHEIMVTYEFVEHFVKDEDGNDQKDKPRWLSETFAHYPRSSERSKASKRLCALDPDDHHEGDWSELVGKACSVTIAHNPGKGKHEGKTFMNISQVSAIPEKYQSMVPELVNDPKLFDIDNPDMDIFRSLPEWLQEKMKGNLEFEGSPLQKALGVAPSAEETVASDTTQDTVEPDTDEDSPY